MGAGMERIGLAGFGAIGQAVAAGVERLLPELSIAAITSGSLENARARAGQILRAPPPVLSLDGVVARSDLVVEAAPARAFRAIALAALGAGRDLLAVSVGALLDLYDECAAAAHRTGARLHVASGAIGGLDAIAGAVVGCVESVTMTTRKPPRALVGAPYLDAHGIPLDALREATVVFDGSAREACRGFPANVNVAAAVSLAGIGPDRTRVRIVADPAIARNTHDIEVIGDFGRLTVHIENAPSANPRTGVLAAQSIIAVLKKLASPIRVGT